VGYLKDSIAVEFRAMSAWAVKPCVFRVQVFNYQVFSRIVERSSTVTVTGNLGPFCLAQQLVFQKIRRSFEVGAPADAYREAVRDTVKSAQSRVALSRPKIIEPLFSCPNGAGMTSSTRTCNRFHRLHIDDMRSLKVPVT